VFSQYTVPIDKWQSDKTPPGQAGGISNIFAYNARISSLMDKQRPQLNSAHQKGPEIPFYGVLIVVGDTSTGPGEVCCWRNSETQKTRKSEMFSPAEPQPSIIFARRRLETPIRLHMSQKVALKEFPLETVKCSHEHHSHPLNTFYCNF